MKLEGVMQSEISQKEKYYIFLFTCGIRIKKKKQAHRYREEIVSCLWWGGKVWGG